MSSTNSTYISTILKRLFMFQFDVNQWLQKRKPRLVERSQIIELAGKALASAGQVPTHDTLTLHGVSCYCLLFQHYLLRSRV